jgi:hypothetical protein
MLDFGYQMGTANMHVQRGKTPFLQRITLYVR